MPVSPDPVRFRQGAGRPSLDFIRTLRHRGTADATEELPDAEALTAWINQFGPCEVDAEEMPGAKQVEVAQNLREAIHQMISAARASDASACGVRSRDLINDAASHPVPAPAMDASGGVHWHSDEPTTATLALLARDALDLASSPAITRVRGCANPECGALFLDTSRPGSRRWCSMNTCGNIAKKNTLRDKVS